LSAKLVIRRKPYVIRENRKNSCGLKHLREVEGQND